MFVRDVMTRNPFTANEKTTIVEALEVMRREKVRRLPILRDGKLVGIVTELDLIRVSPSTATSLSVYELHYLLSKMSVKDAMAKEVITIAPDATIEQAAILMRDNGISGLPVVEGKGLVGIVTETNLFDALLEHFGLRRGGARVTLGVADKPGQLAGIADAIRDMGGNIVSLVTAEPKDGQGEIVVRVTNLPVERLERELKDKGFDVIHITE